DPGLNGQTITLTGGQLLLNKDLTITGPGAGLLTVSGNHTGRVFEVAPGATVSLSGLTIAGGQVHDRGGGILNARPGTGSHDGGRLPARSGLLATTTVRNGGIGGGIENCGTLTVSNSTLANNTAEAGGGGGIENSGTLTVSNSTLANNAAQGGGGILNNGMLT